MGMLSYTEDVMLVIINLTRLKLIFYNHKAFVLAIECGKTYLIIMLAIIVVTIFLKPKETPYKIPQTDFILYYAIYIYELLMFILLIY